MTLWELDALPHRQRDALIASAVMGLDVRGVYYAYRIDGGWSVTTKEIGEGWIADGRGSMQPVYVSAPHWLEDKTPEAERVNGCPIYGLDVVPFYSTDAAADYECLLRVRDEWSHTTRIDHLCNNLRHLWRARQNYAPMQFNDGGLPICYEPGDYSLAALAASTAAAPSPTGSPHP